MDQLTDLVALAARFAPALATLTVVILTLAVVNRSLKRQWRDRPDAQFRFQMIMLGLTLIAIVAVILALPMSDATHGQLLGLLGILLSATIALSSTTFMGNILAGVMLKVIKSARPGDFITVADQTGRITEMDLLHTEIQTEFRDLVTIPNLYMVTQPMKVVRASGTMITAEVSIGYDVLHARVCEALCEAASTAGLTEPFCQVRELGDFAVTYRVAGLLEDVKSLISARSALRKAALDALHGADIEIVSPAFMNQRRVDGHGPFIPAAPAHTTAQSDTRAEDIVFDKAEKAASIEDIRRHIEQVKARLDELGAAGKNADSAAIETLEAQKARLLARLEAAETRQREPDPTD